MLKLRKTFLCLIMLYLFNPFWSPLGCSIIDDALHWPSPLTEKERATLGVVGITRGFYMPEAEIDTFAKDKGAGAAKGAAKGAAEGFLEACRILGHCSGDGCGLVLIFWTATAGTVGTVYGAIHGAIQGYMDALPADEAKRIEQSMEKLYTNLMLQERTSEKLLKRSREKTNIKLVAIEGYGPTVPGEKVDYSPLKNIPIDSVLEICVVKFGLMTWPSVLKPPKNIDIGGEDPSLAVFLNIRPRLIRLSDGKVIYQPRREIYSIFLKRSEWEADNFKLFYDEIEGLMEDIVDKVSDDIFITYRSPGEGIY